MVKGAAMIELKFNKGNPPKDGRYICLIESKGTGTSIKPGTGWGDVGTTTEIPMTEQYICFGNWMFSRWLLDDATTVFRFHNGKDEVIGWCEFEYKGE